MIKHVTATAMMAFMSHSNEAVEFSSMSVNFLRISAFCSLVSFGGGSSLNPHTQLYILWRLVSETSFQNVSTWWKLPLPLCTFSSQASKQAKKQKQNKKKQKQTKNNEAGTQNKVHSRLGLGFGGWLPMTLSSSSSSSLSVKSGSS